MTMDTDVQPHPSLRRARGQVVATSFASLFSIVGIALYGLPLFHDCMVRDFGWSQAQVTSGNALRGQEISLYRLPPPRVSPGCWALSSRQLAAVGEYADNGKRRAEWLAVVSSKLHPPSIRPKGAVSHPVSWKRV